MNRSKRLIHPRKVKGEKVKLVHGGGWTDAYNFNRSFYEFLQLIKLTMLQWKINLLLWQKVWCFNQFAITPTKIHCAINWLVITMLKFGTIVAILSDGNKTDITNRLSTNWSETDAQIMPLFHQLPSSTSFDGTYTAYCE